MVAAAKCFECIPIALQKPVELYLLAVAAGVDTSPTGVKALVANAKCFDCIPKAMREPVEAYLLCALVNK
jgi:hypothetical protein